MWMSRRRQVQRYWAYRWWHGWSMADRSLRGTWCMGGPWCSSLCMQDRRDSFIPAPCSRLCTSAACSTSGTSRAAVGASGAPGASPGSTAGAASPPPTARPRRAVVLARRVGDEGAVPDVGNLALLPRLPDLGMVASA